MVPAKYQKLEDAIRHLKIGDIILVHTRREPISRFIRYSLKSYWEHVALVFETPPKGDINLHDSVFIVETLPWKAIEIHKLNTLLKVKNRYIIGIKRVKILTEYERNRARNIFLSSVGINYNWSTIQNLLAKIYHRLWFLKQLNILDKYICTTFVQNSIYRAALPAKRHKTIFAPQKDYLNQMLYLTFEDIAASDSTEWLYRPIEYEKFLEKRS
jgi:hypothetical protein